MTPFFRESKILKCHPAFIISHLIISKETPAPIEMKLHFFSSEIRKQRWNPSRQSCLDLGVVSQAWRHFFKKKIATEKTNFSSSSNFLWEQNQLYINGCFLHTKLWYGWYGFISFDSMSHPSQAWLRKYSSRHGFLVLQPSKKNGHCNVKMTELVWPSCF